MSRYTDPVEHQEWREAGKRSLCVDVGGDNSRHKLYSWNGQKGQPQQLYSYFQVHINRGSFILNESIADIITTDIIEKVTLGFTDCGP